MDAQKNRLIETVHLSTHNTCFGWEIKNWVLFTHFYQDGCEILLYMAQGAFFGLNSYLLGRRAIYDWKKGIIVLNFNNEI